MPIPKGEDLAKCNNYQAIPLLEVAKHMLATLIKIGIKTGGEKMREEN